MHLVEKQEFSVIMLFSIKRERRKYMLSIYQLMKYLRNTHHINVKSSQTQALRNMGYYHGFKGYRFIREDTNRVNFTSLDQVIALNKYDMQLKTVLYPKVMFIENALKSYVIEALLADSKSENFDVIYNKSLTAYRNHTPGSRAYKTEYTKRMNLKGKINAALVRDYNKRSVVAHFFNNDITIPVWAIFETLTLGEFGTLYDCTEYGEPISSLDKSNFILNEGINDFEDKLSISFSIALTNK